MKSVLKNNVLLLMGYLLSPLSWWNDIFVNIPLAYLLSWPFSILNKKLFLAAFVTSYWFTNVLGFALIHKGMLGLTGREYDLKQLKKDLLVSLIFTLLIVLLVRFGVLTPPQTLFQHLAKWQSR